MPTHYWEWRPDGADTSHQFPPSSWQTADVWVRRDLSIICMQVCGSANAPPEPAGLPDLVPTGDDEVFISSELNSSIFACTQIQYSLPLQKKEKRFPAHWRALAAICFNFRLMTFSSKWFINTFLPETSAVRFACCQSCPIPECI